MINDISTIMITQSYLIDIDLEKQECSSSKVIACSASFPNLSLSYMKINVKRAIISHSYCNDKFHMMSVLLF